MQITTTQNNKLPYSYHVLWVSLASLAVVSLILTPPFALYSMGYISIEAATGVSVVAAIYDSFLLFLITK